MSFMSWPYTFAIQNTAIQDQNLDSSNLEQYISFTQLEFHFLNS